MTEDSITLDLLFRHIDPKQTPFPLDKTTISDLLEASRKYQLPTIMDWFEKEAATTKLTGNPHKATSNKSLLWCEPAFVLALAVKHEIKSLVGPAIALRVGQGAVEEKDRDYGFEAFHAISLIRQKRIQLFTSMIREICNGASVHTSKKGAFTSSTQLICGECGYQRHEWVMDMVESILEAPRWDSFYAAFCGRSQRCPASWSACKTWVSSASDIVDPLKNTMIEVESDFDTELKAETSN